MLVIFSCCQAELVAHYKTIVITTDKGEETRYTHEEAVAMYEQYHGENSSHSDVDGDGYLSFEEWDPRSNPQHEEL